MDSIYERDILKIMNNSEFLRQKLQAHYKKRYEIALGFEPELKALFETKEMLHYFIKTLDIFCFLRNNTSYILGDRNYALPNGVLDSIKANPIVNDQPFCFDLFYQLDIDENGNLFFRANDIQFQLSENDPARLKESYSYRMCLFNDEVKGFLEKTLFTIKNNNSVFWTREKRIVFYEFLEAVRISLNHLGFFRHYSSCGVLVDYQPLSFSWDGEKVKSMTPFSQDIVSKRLDMELYAFNSQLSYYGNCMEDSNVINVCTITPIEDLSLPVKYLHYFTGGSQELFSNLARDYVFLTMNPNRRQRHTIVRGDLNKFDNWMELFNQFGPALFPADRIKYEILSEPHDKDMYEHSLRILQNKPVYVNTKSLPLINTNCHSHKYLPLRDSLRLGGDTGDSFIKLDFPYGGEYNSLLPLSGEQYMWIARLLFAHGWHLINHAVRAPKTREKYTENNFLSCLIIGEGDSVRLPLGFVYQLYEKFTYKGKAGEPVEMTELRKIMEEMGFEYKSTRLRKDVDIAEIKRIISLLPNAELEFSEKWNDSAVRTVKCTVTQELIDMLAVSDENEYKEDDSVDYRKFDRFINKLDEEYMFMFPESRPYTGPYLPETAHGQLKGLMGEKME